MTQTFGRRQPAYSSAATPPSAPSALVASDEPAPADTLADWKAQRRRSTAPARYIFAAAMLLGVGATFLLPAGPALIVRAVLFGLGLLAVTLGGWRWVERKHKD